MEHMEWIFGIIIVLSITIYEIINRYFEYKENIEKNRGEINEYIYM